MKKHNNWNSFSRGILAVLLIAATFCGICGLGATFSEIPWFLIAGGICLLVIVCTIIWGLGYKSRQTTVKESEYEEIPKGKAYDQDEDS